MTQADLAAYRPSRRRRTRTTVAVASLALAAGALTMTPGHADETEVVPASLVRVSTPTYADRDRLVALGLDLTEHGGPGYVEVVLHGGTDADALRQDGFSYTVEVADLGIAWAKSNRLSDAYAASVASSPLPSGRDNYRSLTDYNADLDRLAADYPALVKTISLPHKTIEGRTVRGVEVTENVAAKDGKPVFLMMGLHHVREWPSGEHAIEFAFDLAKN